MIIVKAIIDGKVINVLKFSYEFNQASDVSGRPSQQPLFGGISLTVEARKDIKFIEWMIARNLTKQIIIEIHPAILGGRIRRIQLFDAHLTYWKTNFSATNEKPLSETLIITAGGFEDSFSEGVFSTTWRETFPGNDSTAATVIDTLPELERYYITNLVGEEIERYSVHQKIILNLETKNAIGERLTVSIPDKKYDFKHNGILLKNDTLENYMINNDLEQVELEVVLQQTEA